MYIITSILLFNSNNRNILISIIFWGKILYLYFRLFRFKMKVDSHKVDSNKVEKVTKRHKAVLSYENKRKIVNLFKEIVNRRINIHNQNLSTALRESFEYL